MIQMWIHDLLKIDLILPNKLVFFCFSLWFKIFKVTRSFSPVPLLDALLSPTLMVSSIDDVVFELFGTSLLEIEFSLELSVEGHPSSYCVLRELFLGLGSGGSIKVSLRTTSTWPSLIIFSSQIFICDLWKKWFTCKFGGVFMDNKKIEYQMMMRKWVEARIFTVFSGRFLIKILFCGNLFLKYKKKLPFWSLGDIWLFGPTWVTKVWVFENWIL